MTLPSDANYVAKALGGETRGDQILVPGPGHSANDRSLSIKLDPTFPDGFVTFSFAGDDPAACRNYVREKFEIPNRRPHGRYSNVIAEYVYYLEDGTPYLRVQRTQSKQFWQSHWTGSVWQKGKPKEGKIPYKLPQLINAEEVFLVEGEKDADNLERIGLTATTNSEGAATGSGMSSQKWPPELNKWFRGKRVYVLPDNDEPGEKHAEHVARNLSGVACEVRIVKLPDLPPKGDVSDWLDSGGEVEELIKLSRATPLFVPVAFKSDLLEGPDLDPEIAALNKKYALVLAGDKAVVMKTEADGFRLLKIGAFKQWFSNKHIDVGNKNPSLAEYWLAHPYRRQYEGIEFAPDGGSPNYYNLWRGFAVEPREGECSKFLAHLHDNVAQNDDAAYLWIVGWFAQIVQNPGVKIETSLVLRGKMGVGKTIVGEVIGSLLGDHYALVADPRYVIGQFNAHMASLLLLQADEAFWAGDKRGEGTLKDLISGKNHFLEFKGVDPIVVRNYIRLLVTSNNDWVVPAGFGERRFAILDVGEEHMQDHEYFAAIHDEMNHGGRSALLHYLLNFDISQVDLRSIPKTAALLEQKMESATPEQAWWLDVLKSGELPRGTEQPNTCVKSKLHESYVEHANLHGVRRRKIQTIVGMFLKKHVGPELTTLKIRYDDIVPGAGTIVRRGWGYRFPTLKKCRQKFAEMIQQDIQWENDDDWHHEDEQLLDLSRSEKEVAF